MCAVPIVLRRHGRLLISSWRSEVSVLCCVYSFSPRYLLVRHRSYAIGPHSDLLLVSFSESTDWSSRRDVQKRKHLMRTPWLQTAASRCQEVSFSIRHVPLASHKHDGSPRAVWSWNSGLTCKVSFSVDTPVPTYMYLATERRWSETPGGRRRHSTAAKNIQTATEYHTAAFSEATRRQEVCFSAEKVKQSFKRICTPIRIKVIGTLWKTLPSPREARKYRTLHRGCEPEKATDWPQPFRTCGFSKDWAMYLLAAYSLGKSCMCASRTMTMIRRALTVA